MGKNTSYKPQYRRQGLMLALLALISLAPVSVFAADNTAAIAQGYSVEGDVTPGALVSLADQSKTGAVRLANRDTVDRLVGVVSKNPLVELSGTEKQTQVVISGTVLALVSDVNGDIKYGDKITASPISGVGMRATESGQVVGTASRDFSAAEEVREHSVEDRDGGKRTVKIGLLHVQVNVSYYQAPDEDKTILPLFLQQFVNTIAGRPVSLIRTIIALVLFITGFGGAAILLYSSVRSSIISIGRNPLSAPAVHRSIFEVGAVSVGILLVMLIAVYLIIVI